MTLLHKIWIGMIVEYQITLKYLAMKIRLKLKQKKVKKKYRLINLLQI